MAGQAFRNIADRLTGKEIPFMSLEENNSFMKRLSKLFKG